MLALSADPKNQTSWHATTWRGWGAWGGEVQEDKFFKVELAVFGAIAGRILPNAIKRAD